MSNTPQNNTAPKRSTISNFLDKSFGGRFVTSIGQDLFTSPARSKKATQAAVEKLQLSGEFDKARLLEEAGNKRKFSPKAAIVKTGLAVTFAPIAAPLLVGKGLVAGFKGPKQNPDDASKDTTPSPEQATTAPTQTASAATATIDTPTTPAMSVAPSGSTPPPGLG